MVSYSNTTDVSLLQGEQEFVPMSFVITKDRLIIGKRNEALILLAETKEGYRYRKVTLEKRNEQFGLVLKGGIDSNDVLHVLKIDEDTPASEADINAGDLLVKINDMPVLNKGHDEVIDIIKNGDDTINIYVVSLRDKGRTPRATGDVGLNLLTLGQEHELPLALLYLTQYSSKQNRLLPDLLHVIAHPSDANKKRKEYMLGCKKILDVIIKELNESIVSANKEKVDELKRNFDLHDLIRMCWVNELMISSKQSKVWTRKLLVLRKEELEMYTDFPETAGDWQSPELCYGVCDITWSPLVKTAANSHVYRPHSISLQSSTGGRHIISFESNVSLHNWERELLMEIRDVVTKMNARTFAAKWEGNAVDLTIDLKQGFIIEDSTTATKHWSKKFEELESSSDNGNKELYLTFKDGVKQHLELTELHAVLYTIEAFLKTRVALS